MFWSTLDPAITGMRMRRSKGWQGPGPRDGTLGKEKKGDEECAAGGEGAIRPDDKADEMVHPHELNAARTLLRLAFARVHI